MATYAALFTFTNIISRSVYFYDDMTISRNNHNVSYLLLNNSKNYIYLLPYNGKEYRCAIWSTAENFVSADWHW